ncbi:MAG: hypothetical protein P4N60_08330 [Verrucomicrobiae bacterium]|nr:hypothetical protein [Verrucomicrobiae bacterium]
MLKDELEFFRIIYRFFADGNRLTYAALGVGLFVAMLYFRIFFRDVDGFEDDVDKSERIPILDKNYDYIDSKWSSNKIMIWLLLSVGCGIAAYYQLPDWFPHIFKAP